jgi:hypothetical protein
MNDQIWTVPEGEIDSGSVLADCTLPPPKDSLWTEPADRKGLKLSLWKRFLTYAANIDYEAFVIFGSLALMLVGSVALIVRSWFGS